MDGPTDGPTDGRTDPLIEMRKPHLKMKKIIMFLMETIIVQETGRFIRWVAV